MRCSVFIGTSLDGFIARKDGSIDWLDYRSGPAQPNEDFGYKAFFDSVDVLIMGRKSLETVIGFGLPEWPYGEKPMAVLSRTLKTLPAGCPASVSLYDRSPAELVAKLSAQGMRRAYIDGGQTIQSFFAARLIDDLTITRVPTLLGEGVPLFGPTIGEIPLVHERTVAYDCGLTQSVYRIVHRTDIEIRTPLADGSGCAIVRKLDRYGPTNAAILNPDGTLRARFVPPTDRPEALGFIDVYYVQGELTAILTLGSGDTACVVDEASGTIIRTYEIR